MILTHLLSVDFIEYYWISLNITEYYWILLNITGAEYSMNISNFILLYSIQWITKYSVGYIFTDSTDKYWKLSTFDIFIFTEYNFLVCGLCMCGWMWVMNTSLKHMYKPLIPNMNETP